MARLTIYICVLALLMGCGSGANEPSGSGDASGYRTVEIYGRTWMAENLNNPSHSCGSSWCYGNDASNCAAYGRLYDWCAAMTACPPGWHLPTDADWKDLVWAAGGGDAAAMKLKARKGWAGNGNGTDDFDFSALPGGYGRSDLRTFIGAGSGGFWWSATELDAWVMGSGYGGVERRVFGSQAGLSVRCVRD